MSTVHFNNQHDTSFSPVFAMPCLKTFRVLHLPALRLIESTLSILFDMCSTLTMKQFRGLLERDLSLPESALKGIKDIVQTKVDEVSCLALSQVLVLPSSHTPYKSIAKLGSVGPGRISSRVQRRKASRGS